ncbi:N-6 DNA methylase [Bacteroidota bacterium]
MNEIIKKIIPNTENEIPLSYRFIDKINIYEKEKGKWYLKSFDSDEKEKLVFNEETGKKAPEEIVRQLFIYELIHDYGYPKERIKIEQKVQYGSKTKGNDRADIVVYQNDKETPWILVEVKSPYQKNDIQQLKSYLDAKGSPLGVGFNGKSINRFIRPYPLEFDTLRDLPYEHEFQAAIKAENPIHKIKELIVDRKWTIDELIELNKSKQFNLRAIIEDLEELVLANSGVDSFDEIFKLIYAKLYDEFEAENRDNRTLYFRDYSNAEITYKKISELFDDAKNEWKDVFEPTEKLKLKPEHLEIVIGNLTEIRLYGANLRIIDEAFEYLVPDVSKGKKGQYFTPRVVIDACVKMMNPKRKEYILDPACGSAGFLLHAMEYVWDKNNMKKYKQRSDYANKYLWGIDFEERTTKISRALMLIAGDGKTHIYKENSLDYNNWSSTFTADLKREGLKINDENKYLNFDIIMANPPFAGDIKEKTLINQYYDLLGLRYTYKMEMGNINSILNSFAKEFNLTFIDEAQEILKEKFKEINKNDDIDLEDDADLNTAILEIAGLFSEIVDEGDYQEQFLASRLREVIKFKKNESSWTKVDRHILFIQRFVDLLKPGGRGVVVLPQGIFNNSNEKYVRRFITDKARILGVIGLHGNSFKPHTGTKTSLLLFRKYTEDEIHNGDSKNNYPIFFATSKLSFKDNSGKYLYAWDEKNNSTILDEKCNPMYLTDLFYIAGAFKEWGLKQLSNGDKMYSFLKDK